MGTRDKAADIDFSDFLEEEAESQLKEAGEWQHRVRGLAAGCSPTWWAWCVCWEGGRCAPPGSAACSHSRGCLGLCYWPADLLACHMPPVSPLLPAPVPHPCFALQPW